MARPGFFLVTADNVESVTVIQPTDELHVRLKEPIEGFHQVTLQAGVLAQLVARPPVPEGTPNEASVYVEADPAKLNG